jgi:hypothetical protein
VNEEAGAIAQKKEEGTIEGKTRRGKRRKLILENVKETKKRKYTGDREESLYRTLSRISFGKGYGHVSRIRDDDDDDDDDDAT